jgi:hypothetical protein
VKDLRESSGEIICKIPVKLPGLNEYTAACRGNAYAGAKMKKQAEASIMPFIARLPVLRDPVTIRFVWSDKGRRDFDNICFAKKFILDALVKAGKLPDDNRKHVTGFVDEFVKGDYSVTLYIKRGDKYGIKKNVLTKGH